MTRRALILALSLVFASAAHAKVRVVTTLSDLGAITRAVGGDHVEVMSLAKGYQNPHHIDPKPSFIVDLSRADLFVQVGMELEVGWVPPLLNASRNPRIQGEGVGYVNASRGIPVLQRPTSLSRAEGDIHVAGNPHYWLDPENGKIIARNIVLGLKRVDAKNAADYDRGLHDFNNRVNDLLKRTQEKMRSVNGAKVVSYHNTWPYFTRRYGLEMVGFLEPKPGIPPSGAHLAELIPRMKSEGVKVILREIYFADSVANRVAQQTGAKIVEVPPSVGGEKGTEDYFALIDHIVDKVVAALK